MKRMWTGAAVLLGVTVGVMVNVGAAGSQEPAIVIKNDGLCGMVGANADGNITFGGIGVATTRLENNSKVMMKCRGEEVTNLTGQAQSFSGFACGFEMPDGPFLITEDTHATVSASGVGTLTCTFEK